MKQDHDTLYKIADMSNGKSAEHSSAGERRPYKPCVLGSIPDVPMIVLIIQPAHET